MHESRIHNSIKNISFGLLTQVIQMLLGFVSRTFFIRYLEVEYLGVNSLFSSILTLLSLAELGITSAILYALYKPLADKNEEQIAVLMNFFKKVYYKIAAAVALFGLLIFSFLDTIVTNPPKQIATDLSLIYFLFLFNSVASYFFYYKLSLFHADQKSYIISGRNIIISIIQAVLQILILIFYQNFIFYLIVQLLCQLGGNMYLSQLVEKNYPYLDKYPNSKLNPLIKKEIYSNLKATAIIKFGGLIVNNSTNIILNYFSGLAAIGLFSNYVLLVGLISGVIAQIFSSLTSSIAHVNASESLEKKREIFFLMNFANFWIYGFAAVSIVLFINDFILLWIGHKFTLPFLSVVIIALNFYMVGLQNAVWTYRQTLGLFNNGRWLILLTALLNLFFSLVLGSWFGLVGILISLTISRLLTNTWYDPYVVFKYALQLNPIIFLKRYIYYFSFLIFITFLCYYINSNFSSLNSTVLIFKLFLFLVIFNLFLFLFFRKSKDMNLLIEVFKFFFKLKVK